MAGERSVREILTGLGSPLTGDEANRIAEAVRIGDQEVDKWMLERIKTTPPDLSKTLAILRGILLRQRG